MKISAPRVPSVMLRCLPLAVTGLLPLTLSSPAWADEALVASAVPQTPTAAAAVPAPAPAATPAPAADKAPAEPAKAPVLKSLALYPDHITLETKRDFHRFTAVATTTDDISLDLTTKAKFTLADPSLAAIKDGELLPLKDGTTTLTVTWQDKTTSIPVVVKNAETDRPVSYRLDVMPILMRNGCNTGSCHGAARGQDGFHLSLFGFDPDGDHYRLTQELSGRRVNLGVPEDSLILTKSVNSVPHTGGKLMEPDSTPYNVLKEWVINGVPNDPPTVPTVTKVEIFPPSGVLEGQGAMLQFTARATYSDGTDRDITPLAVFKTSNEPSASITKDGLVTAGARGEAFIMARFDTFTVGSQVIIIPDKLQYARPTVPENNYVDTLVHEKLHRLRVIPSELCDDATFLRRVYIDIVGLLPEEADAAKFLADTAPDKRAKLIDELLGRKEFVEMWVMKWAELLQIRTNNVNQVSYKSTLLYFNWLRDRLAKNVPFNQIVQELLGSSGGTFTNPATNYYQIERDTLKVAENVAQVFMGMRMQCAQCHNHPFDRWTMNDYYGFAAFFGQIGRKQAEDPRETVVFDAHGGEVNHLVTKQPVKPKFLGGAVPDKPNEDRRKVMAEWLASPENPFFAKNLANMVWAHFFGVGIIEPVDDVRVSNPASNPELLTELGKRFTDYKYDFKSLVRDICNSRTYQLSSRVNDSNVSDQRNFSHSLLRRQRAEVMLDTLTQVTGTQNKFQGLPKGARAVQIADGNVSNYFLRTFGRAERASVCSCEVKMDPNLGQALHLINGDITSQRIGEGKLVQQLLDQKKTPEEIVNTLYMRCFTRQPTEPELKKVTDAIAATPNETQGILEDLFWALLNSKEFMFNH